jgi:NAD(P)-dependent dehydrogenase (short-subunit alcohol dehydrogenase family)
MTTGTSMQGRVVLVTGGGGEIGSAIARRMAGAGAAVAVGDVVQEKAEATAASIVATGGSAIALALDVGAPASAEAAIASTVRQLGKLTTLVNVAAAVTPDGTVVTLPLDEWEKALRINLTGAFIMCKFAIPEIKKAGGGAIVSIASQLGHLVAPGRSPYCTSKAALIAFTRVIALDHASDGIRANTISPGFILTERSSKRSGGKEAAARLQGPKHALGRPGDVEDIAAGALYLASDESRFVTATDLLIDGGFVAFKGTLREDGTPGF